MIELFILDIINFFCIYLIVSLSLNFQQGYTGIPNLGIYLPVIIGAFTVSYFPGRLAMKILAINSGLDFASNNTIVLSMIREALRNDPLTLILLFVITIIIVATFSSVVGYLSAYPAIKLPSLYLAVFLLCLAESARIIGIQTPWIAGGYLGVNTINPFWWLGGKSYLGSSALIISITAVIYFIYHKMCNAPLSRVLKAIREDELAIKCGGRNTLKIKKKVMALSYATAGVAGALHAFHMGVVDPVGYSRVDFSFWPWLMMTVGGAGNNLGTMLGTFVLVIIRRLMIIIKQHIPFLPFDVIWVEPILLAIMLALTMILRPAGILPEKGFYIKTLQKITRNFKSSSATLQP
jgi:branched-chain amino acid transport system permease protein